MLVEVVGTKRFDGEVEGREYHTTTLFCIEKDVQLDGLIGDRVTTLKVPDAVNPPPLEVGGEYVVYYGSPRVDRSGTARARIEFIQRVKK